MSGTINISKYKIERALLSTLQDPAKWGGVLELLIQETGSTKGVILQRDTATGLLMIPKSLPENLAQPLLRGFSKSEMFDYESNYAEDDPWTAIELQFQSTEPYALSSYLALDALKKHKIYNWLEHLGITDTVVMDIYRGEDYWVAVNLFFDVHNTQVKDRCIELLNEIQVLLQTMWHALIKSYTLPPDYQPMAYFLEHRDKAEMVISNTGRVLALSSQAKTLVGDGSFPILIKSSRIFIRNQVLRERFWSFLLSAFSEFDKSTSFEFEGYWFNVTNISKHFDLVGKDQGLKLLSFNKGYSTDFVDAPVWECELLTKREKELVKVLAHGGRVVDFQKKHNIAKSTAHNCWSMVKKKLNITDRTQLIDRNTLMPTLPNSND